MPKGKTAWEVASVIGIILTFHCQFFARVQLRNSTNAQGKGNMHHGPFKCCSLERHESHGVMIICERSQFQWVWIKRVVLQLIWESAHGKFVGEHKLRNIPERKVENRIELCINPVPPSMSADKECGLRGITFKQ